MRALIAEDTAIGRFLIQEFLKPYGTTDVAEDGQAAVRAYDAALDSREPYDVVCLDIMMPEIDGRRALRLIRAVEASRGIARERGAKIVMTTALSGADNVEEAKRGAADAYLVKPIDRARLLGELRRLGIIT